MGGLRVGGADCLGPGAPLPSPLTRTHTNTYTKLSLRFPRGVITVPIIIHASQGCSHADCHLDTHKHSNPHTPPLHFEPVPLNRPRSTPYTEVHNELLVPSFSVTQTDAARKFFVFLLLP